jgi:hypothetical protein
MCSECPKQKAVEVVMGLAARPPVSLDLYLKQISIDDNVVIYKSGSVEGSSVETVTGDGN